MAIARCSTTLQSFAISTLIVCLFKIQNGTTAYTVRQQLHQVGLLVKVSTADEEMIINDSDFISAVYSNSTYSVSKQMNACSSKRASTLVPYQSNESSIEEVFQVRLPNNSSSYNRTSIVKAAIDRVKLHVGLDESILLGDVIDFVVFCVPAALSGPAFLASGAYKSFWIVAKASACTNPKILLHEFGHLFGMKHARRDDDEYGDETSVMGRTSNSENRCFNGYNFWRLGWFNNDYAREIVTVSVYQFPVIISLATFLDVPKLQSKQQHAVVLKIDDLYLVYNRRKGCNDETGAFPDMVTVVRALETEESDLVAGINETEGSNLYRYTNKAAKLVTIQICHRHHGNATTVDNFVVAIGMDNFPCASSLDEKYMSKTPTASPSGMLSTPTLHVGSEYPNLIVQPFTPTPSPGTIDVSSTRSPTTGEADVDRFSHAPAISPKSTKPTINRAPKSTAPTMKNTLTPTIAPQLRRVPVVSYPAPSYVPTISRSNIAFIDYTQSPFPPVRHDYQQNNFVTAGRNEPSKNHFLHIAATASIIGLAFVVFILCIIRIRKSRIASNQIIIPQHNITTKQHHRSSSA